MDGTNKGSIQELPTFQRFQRFQRLGCWQSWQSLKSWQSWQWGKGVGLVNGVSEVAMRVLLLAMPNVMVGLDRTGKFPNLGVASLAGNVEGCDVKIADLVLVRRRIGEYVVRLVKDYRPHLVGLSCMSFQYATAIALAKLIKAVDASVRIVLGGYHPTLLYEEIGERPEGETIDFIVRGEGEATFRELVEALSSGSGMEEIPGLSYKMDGTFRHNRPRGLLDLSAIRPPDRTVRLLQGFSVFGRKSDAIETSRGCTFQCKFCSIGPMYGRTFRTYAIPRVIEDIWDARRYGAELLFIVDDNITLDGTRLEAICDAIVGHRLDDLHYFVQTSVRGIASSERLVRKMARAGFKAVFLGLENVSRRNLAFLSKDQRVAEWAEAAVAYLREHKILTIGGLILGQPEDTEEDFWANYVFARRLKLDGPLFFVATPHVKTALREELKREGLITNETDYSWYNGSKANIRTHVLSSDDIDRLVMQMYARYLDLAYLKFTNIWRVYPEFFAHRLIKDVPKVLRGQILRRLSSGEDTALAGARKRDHARRKKWLLEASCGSQ